MMDVSLGVQFPTILSIVRGDGRVSKFSGIVILFYFHAFLPYYFFRRSHVAHLHSRRRRGSEILGRNQSDINSGTGIRIA